MGSLEGLTVFEVNPFHTQLLIRVSSPQDLIGAEQLVIPGSLRKQLDLSLQGAISKALRGQI